MENVIIFEDSEHFWNMERFADYTNEQIKTRNTNELKRIFSFQESKIDFINNDLKNIINVSYLEALMLGEYANQMDEIIKLMPTKLRWLYKEYQSYYNKLGKSN